MKLSYPVKLSGIKHEFDPKHECVMTTMHLELPSGVDLRMLQRIYRRSLDPSRGEAGEFKVLLRDEAGAPRRVSVVSKGTKTKDFALFAVVMTPFSKGADYEAFLDEGYPAEPEQEAEVVFEAELILPENLVTQAARQFDQDMRDQGLTVTLTSGDKTVKLGKKDNLDA